MAEQRNKIGSILLHLDGKAPRKRALELFDSREWPDVPGAGAGLYRVRMIHKTWCVVAGNCDDLTKTAAWLDKFDGTIAATYAQETGQDLDKILTMMSDETWLTAQESVDLGFADSIAEGTDKTQNTAGRSWNLSAYAKAPCAVDEGTCRTCGKKTADCLCGRNAKEEPTPAGDDSSSAQATPNNEQQDNRERYERMSRILVDSSRPDSRAV